MVMFSYAQLKDQYDEHGRPVFVHIDSVEKDDNLDLICPECKENLLIRKGKVNAHHFAHLRKTKCAGADESITHKLGKYFVLQNQGIPLPTLSFYNSLREKSQYFIFEKEKLFFDKVEDEVIIKDGETSIIADALGYKNGEAYAIEIYVTHHVDEEKLNIYKQRGISVLEIDLSRYRSCDFKKIAKGIFEEIENKNWLYNHQFENVLSNYRAAGEDIQLNGLKENISCPLNVWDGNYIKRKKQNCVQCPFCLDHSENKCLCGYKNGISDFEDLNENNELLWDKRNSKIEEKDDENIRNCICPVCGDYYFFMENEDGQFNLFHESCNSLQLKINLKEKCVLYRSRFGNIRKIPYTKAIIKTILWAQAKYYSDKGVKDIWYPNGVCPRCSSWLKLCPGRNGKWFVGCSNYRNGGCGFFVDPIWEKEYAIKKIGDYEVKIPVPEKILQEYRSIMRMR